MAFWINATVPLGSLKNLLQKSTINFLEFELHYVQRVKPCLHVGKNFRTPNVFIYASLMFVEIFQSTPEVFTLKILLKQTKIRSAYEIFYVTCKLGFKVSDVRRIKNFNPWHFYSPRHLLPV